MNVFGGLISLVAAVTGSVEPEIRTSSAALPNQNLPAVDPHQFDSQPAILSNGIGGRVIQFPSRNPLHFREWFSGEGGVEVGLAGQLFVPRGESKRPLILIVPGSGNIGTHHLHQASLLVSEGFAVFLIDPFKGRGIRSTAGNQAQLSWAASVHDIFAAIDAVRGEPEVDPQHIGLLGSSRGGFAVITAMMAQVSGRNLHNGHKIVAGFAGYPWCGLQFWHPKLAAGTKLEIFAGTRDDWVSVQQCQDFVHAISQRNSGAKIKLLAGAGHAFDRFDVALTSLPDIPRTTRYPTVYMDDGGNFINPATGEVDSNLQDDFFLGQVIEGGFVERGVTIGSKDDEAKIYEAEMVSFFKQELGRTPSFGGL